MHPEKPVSTWAVSYCLNLGNVVRIHMDLHQFCNVGYTYSDDVVNGRQVCCKFHSYLRAVFGSQQLLAMAATVPQVHTKVVY